MTISSTLNRVSTDGNGATTAYPVSFPFQKQADLIVLSTVIATGVSTTQVITTHYTISGTTNPLGHYPNGGNVNFLVAPASTVRITIYRDPARTQGLDLQDLSTFPAESLEAQLDYVTMLTQRVADLIGRSLRQPDGDNAAIGTLPSSVARASKFQAYDSNGDPIAAAGTSANLAPVSTFINTLLDDASAAIARVTLGFSAIAAKGDLLVGAAADTINTLPAVATTGMGLVVDPAAATGLRWNDPAQPNPIINPNVEVWQQGTTFAAVANNDYTADMYQWHQAGTGVVTIRQSTNVPSVANAGVLFNFSLEVDVTTADAAIGAGDTYNVTNKIEGYNWRHFAQRVITVSFWVISTKTGIHSFAIRNSGTDRYYIAEYTVAASDVWQKVTMTIPASPSAGTWNYTTGIGAELLWVLAAGTTFQGTVGAWTTGAVYASANQVNVMDSTANFFRVDGITMNVGSVALPIQYQSFDDALFFAKRYFKKSFNYATAPAQNAGLGGAATLASQSAATAANALGFPITFAPSFRVAPSITTYNPSAANAQARNTDDAVDDSATAAVNASDSSMTITATPNAGNTAGDLHAVHWTASSQL